MKRGLLHPLQKILRGFGGCLGRADQRRPQRPGERDVVHVPAAAGDQPGILLAPDRLPDVFARRGRASLFARLGRDLADLGGDAALADLLAHAAASCWPPTVGPLTLAASSTALTMLW